MSVPLFLKTAALGADKCPKGSFELGEQFFFQAIKSKYCVSSHLKKNILLSLFSFGLLFRQLRFFLFCFVFDKIRLRNLALLFPPFISKVFIKCWVLVVSC